MEQDTGALILGGVVGAGSLLLAWAIAWLADALVGLTKALRHGIDLRVYGLDGRAGQRKVD